MIAHNGIFDELLCNRTATGDDVTTVQVREGCTHNTRYIITRISIEILILNSDFSMLKVRRYFREWHTRLYTLIDGLIEQSAMRVVHLEAVLRQYIFERCHLPVIALLRRSYHR